MKTYSNFRKMNQNWTHLLAEIYQYFLASYIFTQGLLIPSSTDEVSPQIKTLFPPNWDSHEGDQFFHISNFFRKFCQFWYTEIIVYSWNWKVKGKQRDFCKFNQLWPTNANNLHTWKWFFFLGCINIRFRLLFESDFAQIAFPIEICIFANTHKK